MSQCFEVDHIVAGVGGCLCHLFLKNRRIASRVVDGGHEVHVDGDFPQLILVTLASCPHFVLHEDDI